MSSRTRLPRRASAGLPGERLWTGVPDGCLGTPKRLSEMRSLKNTGDGGARGGDLEKLDLQKRFGVILEAGRTWHQGRSRDGGYAATSSSSTTSAG